jgi:hypothetical protein
MLRNQAEGDTSFEVSSQRETTSEGINEERLLECFCGQLSTCTGPLEWSLGIKDNSSECKEDQCFGVVEIPLLGVTHKLAGAPKDTEREAFVDVARRALWYLGCPGYETLFQPDRLNAAGASHELEAPSSFPPDESNQVAVDEADRKTAVMRTQNRLQQLFAIRRLHARKGVWEWSYETDPNDAEWPPLFRATVQIPMLGKSFAGDWARGQREAQIDAVTSLNVFLDGVAEEKSR